MSDKLPEDQPLSGPVRPPTIDARLVEAIDACRPGSRDCAALELAPLADRLLTDSAVAQRYDRVQRFDARVMDAMADVPVPQGLAGRITARLDQAPTAAAPAAAVPAAAVPEGSSPSLVPIAAQASRPSVSGLVTPAPTAEGASAARRPRRRWVYATLALAGSLLLAATLSLLAGRSLLTPDEVPSVAAQWYHELPAGDWLPLASRPQGFEFPRGLGASPRAWQAVDADGHAPGVAYDLSAASRGRAVLFVLPASDAEFPTTPGENPQSSTGGLAIGAWQSSGLLYVLVVQGDDRAYRRLIHATRPPLA